MQFSTPVAIAPPPFQIEPLEEMLFVGSCFAAEIGQRFAQEHFRATVNPFGTMYNPVSVLHTVERLFAAGAEGQACQPPRVAFVTLGTNHVYRLKATGEIVDNCQKRPQHLFSEERLSVAECAACLEKVAALLRARHPGVAVVFTVSPIRYAKYGFHESQLSKATLLLAIEHVLEADAARLRQEAGAAVPLTYFPAYEIVLDELRDYRFYKPDMLHPTEQTVEYVWQRLSEHYFSQRTHEFLRQWEPLRKALAHRPFHPESPDYQQFLADVRRKEADLLSRFAPATQ